MRASLARRRYSGAATIGTAPDANFGYAPVRCTSPVSPGVANVLSDDADPDRDKRPSGRKAAPTRVAEQAAQTSTPARMTPFFIRLVLLVWMSPDRPGKPMRIL